MNNSIALSILTDENNNNICMVSTTTTMLLLNISLLTTFLLIKIYHPLIFLSLTIYMTLSFSALMYLNLQSPIYSFILFIVMIGGLMIMFLYFTSLINNEKMSSLLKIFMTTFFIYLSLTIFTIWLDGEYIITFIKADKYEIFHFQYVDFKVKLNNLYYKNMLYFYLVSIIMLMVSLFNIIKMCSKKKMSLRKMF